ncbi:MAG: NUDIX domain-containing protein [Chlamydiota bacterium]
MKTSCQFPLTTVGGLILASDGTILFVRSQKWSDLYTLPGGKVELGESRESAFEREIMEETGLALKNIQFAICQDSIFNDEYHDPKHFVMHDYIAEIAEGVSKSDVSLNDEAYEYCWLTLEEARTKKMNREVYKLLDWYEAFRKNH